MHNCRTGAKSVFMVTDNLCLLLYCCHLRAVFFLWPDCRQCESRGLHLPCFSIAGGSSLCFSILGFQETITELN